MSDAHPGILPGLGEISAVVLDMDGTLLDLYFDDQVWNCLLPQRFAASLGVELDTAKTMVTERLQAARGTLDWYCLDYWTSALGIDVAGLENELSHLVQPRPGALNFLTSLQSHGYRTILATNAHPESMQRKFELTGINQYFSATESSHYFGYCKEQSAFWPQFCEKLDVDPSSAVLIDDNENVLEAARRFGIAHLYGIKLPNLRGAVATSDRFYCVDSFTELLPEIV